MNNLHYNFMGYIPCYTQEKTEIYEKLLKMIKKCYLGGQDDVIGSKW